VADHNRPKNNFNQDKRYYSEEKQPEVTLDIQEHFTKPEAQTQAAKEIYFLSISCTGCVLFTTILIKKNQ